MAGIADKIKLYNAAYQVAWVQLNSGGRFGADDGARLDKIIRVLIKMGQSNPDDVAAEAINRFCGTKL